jgi:hypothetical protein
VSPSATPHSRSTRVASTRVTGKVGGTPGVIDIVAHLALA